MRTVTPSDDEPTPTPGGGGTGGGGAPTTPTVWAKLSPPTQTIATPGPVQLVPEWGGGTAVLTPGSPTITTGQALTVNPTSTTVYTLTVTPTTGTPVVTSTTITVGGVASVVTRFLDLKWTYTEPSPTGSCLGFDVLLFYGTDPANTDNWIQAPTRCESTDRRLTTSLTLYPGTTVNAAVRAIYSNDKKSPWTKIAAGILFQ